MDQRAGKRERHRALARIRPKRHDATAQGAESSTKVVEQTRFADSGRAGERNELRMTTRNAFPRSEQFTELILAANKFGHQGRTLRCRRLWCTR
jgi:hypothetical protein